MPEDRYELVPTENYLEFALDDETYLPYTKLHYFSPDDHSGFIAFVNRTIPELLIYDTRDQSLVKKINYQTEGDNALKGRISDLLIKDMDHIYISILSVPVIQLSDSDGNIKQTIDYKQTTNGEALISMSSVYGEPVLIGHSFYLTQGVNTRYGKEIMEKSRTGIVIDTLTKEISYLPMTFPSLITDKDIGTSAGIGAEFYRCFDGVNFIYSFRFSDDVYIADINHENIVKKEIKSKYATDVKVLRLSPDLDFNQALKTTAEKASYGNVIYDKYRNVYYLIAQVETELEQGEDYVEIIRYGKKQFSVIILDDKLNIIGETLLPAFTYVPNMYFINQDGIYFSRSHYKNPEFDDNRLCFERLELKEKAF